MYGHLQYMSGLMYLLTCATLKTCEIASAAPLILFL